MLFMFRLLLLPSATELIVVISNIEHKVRRILYKLQPIALTPKELSRRYYDITLSLIVRSHYDKLT